MVTKGIIGERIEFASFYVSFDLAIPCSRVKLGEPPPKLFEFLRREGGDRLLERFEFTHRRKIPPHLFAGQCLSKTEPANPRVTSPDA